MGRRGIRVSPVKNYLVPEWNDVRVVIDGENYEARAIVSNFGDVLFGSHSMWASSALQSRMDSEAGLTGRVQVAITRALTR